MAESDYGLAFLALVESGSSEDVARETLARYPNLTATLAPPMRERFEREAAQASERAYWESPEGQREALEAEDAQAEARASLAQKARASLVRNGVLDEAGAAALSDDEAIWTRGLERKPYELMTRDEADREAVRLIQAGEYGAMSPYERAAVAGQLSVSRAALDEAAGIAPAGDSDGSGSGGGEGGAE